MDEPKESGPTASPAPSGPRTLLFVALLGLYYAAYYWVFVYRLSEYFHDLMRHFAFFRRLF
jgi:hypothetical protein